MSENFSLDNNILTVWGTRSFLVLITSIKACHGSYKKSVILTVLAVIFLQFWNVLQFYGYVSLKNKNNGSQNSASVLELLPSTFPVRGGER